MHVACTSSLHLLGVLSAAWVVCVCVCGGGGGRLVQRLNVRCACKALGKFFVHDRKGAMLFLSNSWTDWLELTRNLLHGLRKLELNR